MSQADTPKVPLGRGKAIAVLVIVFLLGLGVGCVLGRWSSHFEGELEQSGEIALPPAPLAINHEVDIRYPLPYVSLPFLKVEEPIISYEIEQQSPQGFRMRITNSYANFNSAPYTAKGIPSSR